MHCKSCYSNNLNSIFSFGETPLANSLLKLECLGKKETKYNLEILFCQQCSLVQLKDTLSPHILFDDYLYYSSNSDTMLSSAKKLVDSLISQIPLDAKVIEIASNDGYLLKNYIEKKITVLGIEPAKNIASFANQQQIPTKCAYFNVDLANELITEFGHADVIHANNVLAHVPEINNFVKGLKILLAQNGKIVIEIPYLLDMIKHCEFDTIYHEHVFYFSLIPLISLFKKHDLMIYDVEKLDIHGGTLRLFIGHESEKIVTKRFDQLLENEYKLGLDQFAFYVNFSNAIQSLKLKLLETLQNLKANNKRIAAYGASAKGTTLLNYFNVGKDYIEFVVDRSQHKHGYFTPGKHLPIYDPKKLIEEKIDYTLLLTWNFKEEILAQQDHYRRNGGKFIIPIPEFMVI